MMITVPSLTSVINQLLPEPHVGLLAGLLFGSKTSLGKDLYQALIITGTLHIAALSGMNISLVTNAMAKIFLNFVSNRIASLLTILVIIWFVNFVGLSPSVVRAAIMGCLSLIAVIFGRQNWAIYSWLLAVSTMLVINMRWLFDLSFQLSALASLGIILFGGVKKTNFVYDSLRLTLAAQVFTIPLIFLHFQRISLISPLTNLLIGWVVLPATVLGWLAAFAGSFWLPLGFVPAWLAWGLLEYLIRVVEWTSKIPLAAIGF